MPFTLEARCVFGVNLATLDVKDPCMCRRDGPDALGRLLSFLRKAASALSSAPSSAGVRLTRSVVPYMGSGQLAAVRRTV
jgi:hypothetical protein